MLCHNKLAARLASGHRPPVRVVVSRWQIGAYAADSASFPSSARAAPTSMPSGGASLPRGSPHPGELTSLRRGARCATMGRSRRCVVARGSIAGAGSKDYAISPRYFVVQQGGDYEVRLYDTHSAARADGGGDRASLAAALRRLEAYAGGGNDRGEALRPRQPVVINVDPDGSPTIAMAFMLDSGGGKATTSPPEPLDSDVRIEKRLGQVLAVIPIDGDPMTPEAIDRAKGTLLEALQRDEIGRRNNVNMKGTYQIALFLENMDSSQLAKAELRVPIRLTL